VKAGEWTVGTTVLVVLVVVEGATATDGATV
jgi:hypothetical protein